MSDTDRSTVATNTTTALATAVRDLGMSPAAALTDLASCLTLPASVLQLAMRISRMRRNSGRRLNLKPALRRRSEVQYQKSLLAIVDQINQIVTGSYDGSQASAESIAKSLVDYSGVIDDWAEMVGRKMFAQVEREEWNQWRSVSEEISAGLRDVIGNTLSAWWRKTSFTDRFAT
jgi:hypothetical protein